MNQKERSSLLLWTNREVPPNYGGVRLGQAALAARALPYTPSSL